MNGCLINRKRNDSSNNIYNVTTEEPIAERNNKSCTYPGSFSIMHMLHQT